MYLTTINADSFSDSYFNAEKHNNVQCVRHIHNNFELVFVYSGQLIMNVNGCDRILTAGQATLMMPFDRHSFFTPKESRCIVVEFSPGLVEEFYEKVRNKMPSEDVFYIDGRVVEFCESFLSGGQADLLSNKAALYPLCNEVLKNCDFEDGRREVEGAFIEAVKYIADNFSNEELALTDVASAIGVHHVYLSRVFARNAGMNFKSYLALLRCNGAAKLLKKDKQRTVSEIAYEVGFGSIRSFNRQFLEIFGVSPIKYRES